MLPLQPQLSWSGPALVNPPRSRTSWIDELPNNQTPARVVTGPSAHASAFAKSIPKLKLPVYTGTPEEWPRAGSVCSARLFTINHR